MRRALTESKKLAKLLLTKKQVQIVQTLLDEIYEDKDFYSFVEFWKVDAKIGGIGGYCMPANPVYNPIPAGIGRKLFRPLQYARTDIEICDVKHTAKYAVQNSGMHLEAAAKYYLQNNNRLGSLRFRKITLGQAVHKLKELKAFDEKTIEALSVFVQLHNKTKHNVNQDDNRPRLFSPSDALICYLSSRILGMELLRSHYDKIVYGIGKYMNSIGNQYIDWEDAEKKLEQVLVDDSGKWKVDPNC